MRLKLKGYSKKALQRIFWRIRPAIIPQIIWTNIPGEALFLLPRLGSAAFSQCVENLFSQCV